MRKTGNTTFRWVLPAVFAVLLIAYLASFTIINFCGFERFCSGDMYEDTYVSRLMWEQKTLFPENWTFGNQFYVITTPVLAALIYGMTGSVNLSMAIATTIMTALTLLSFIWMIKPFASRKELLFGTLLLVSAVVGPYIVDTIEGQILYLMASYYAGYIITLFVVFGDYIRYATGKISRFVTISLVLSLFLSFCTGMQSLRQTAIMVLPLLAYEALRWLIVLIKMKKIPGGEQIKCTLRAGLIAAANLLGYLASKLLDVSSVTIYGDLSIISGQQMSENMATGFRALKSITGIKYLFGSDGDSNIFIGLFSLLLIAAVIFALVQYIRSRSRGNDGLFICLALCFISIAAVLAINVVVNLSLRSIYLFVWYPLVALSAMLLFRHLKGVWRGGGAAVLCLFIACNLYNSYYPCVEDALAEDTTPEAEICAWIEENGYDTLYGEWNTAAEIAAYSDGGVTAGAWYGAVYQILGYINPLDVYSEEDNKTAVYIVTPWNREEALRLASENGAEMTLQKSFDDGYFELYTSSKQLMYFA